MLEIITNIARIGLLVTAFASWLAIGIYGFKAMRRARPGVKLWGRDTLWNPCNVLLRSDLLTEVGQIYRNKCLVAIVIFVACIIGIPFFIEATKGNLG